MASTLPHGSRTRLVLVAFLAILQGLFAGRLVTDIRRGRMGGPVDGCVAVLILCVFAVLSGVACTAKSPRVLRSFKHIMLACAVSLILAAIAGIIAEARLKAVFDWPPCISWALIAATVAFLFGRIEKQGKAVESTG